MEIKTVDVMGLKYRLTTKPPKGEEAEYIKGLEGLCNCKDKTIWINKSLEGGHKIRTILHELGHATLERNALHYTDILEPNIEEIIVETNATVVHKFYSDLLKRILKENDITKLKNQIRSLL